MQPSSPSRFRSDLMSARLGTSRRVTGWLVSSAARLGESGVLAAEHAERALEPLAAFDEERIHLRVSASRVHPAPGNHRPGPSMAQRVYIGWEAHGSQVLGASAQGAYLAPMSRRSPPRWPPPPQAVALFGEVQEVGHDVLGDPALGGEEPLADVQKRGLGVGDGGQHLVGRVQLGSRSLGFSPRGKTASTRTWVSGSFSRMAFTTAPTPSLISCAVFDRTVGLDAVLLVPIMSTKSLGACPALGLASPSRLPCEMR